MIRLLRVLPPLLLPALLLAASACQESANDTDTGGGTPGGGQDANGDAAGPGQVIEAGRKYTATISTDRGDIVIELFADRAPRTVNSFVYLARRGYFDGITFHRVVPGFVVQGGDPEGTGLGGPGYELEEDQNDLSNLRGMVSMAKAAGSTKVGSQFFINLDDNPELDVDNPAINQKRFYPFGQVVQGMDVVDIIQPGDVMHSVTISEE